MLVQVSNPIIIGRALSRGDRIRAAANDYLSLRSRPIGHIEKSEGKYHHIKIDSAITSKSLKDWVITILKVVSYATLLFPLIA